MRTKTLALLTALAFVGTAGSALANDKMGASGSPCNTTAAANQTTTGTGPAGTNTKVNAGSGGTMAKSGGTINSAKGSQDVTTGSGPAGSNNDNATTGRAAGKVASDC